MNENARLGVCEKKLGNICEKNSLLYTLDVSSYPISLIIKPDCGGIEGQMSMLEAADTEPFNSADAKIMMYVEDGVLCYKMSERFTIGDALLSKIKNLFKKIHAYYLQMFHRDVLGRKLLSAPYEREKSDGNSATESENPSCEEPIDCDEMESAECVDGLTDESPDFPDGLFADDEAPKDDRDMTRMEYLAKKATELAMREGKITLPMIRAELNATYAESARVMDALEEAGIVGDTLPDGSREVILKPECGAANE